MAMNHKCRFSTPDLSHLTSADFEHVYEPAEDSFLMLDALEEEYDVLKKLEPAVCVEVGCGSGVGITFLASMLGPHACYLCSDVNPIAAQVARRTGEHNGVIVHPVLCDLCSAMEDRLKGQVDVLLFNPPYVVTPSSEVSSGGIEASWAGGAKGREVTDRFLPTVSRLLSPAGIFYLIVIKENVVEEIEAALKKDGFHMTVVMSRKAGREHLSVLKFSRGT
ncbi:methyltransferase HEMK2-like isoform X2 [Babylonia areolata]